MGEPARPKLSPGLWADILAKYGALGRPLTDDELRAIVAPADSFGDLSLQPLAPVDHRPAAALVVVCGFVEGEFVMTPAIWARAVALHRQVGRCLTADELEGCRVAGEGDRADG